MSLVFESSFWICDEKYFYLYLRKKSNGPELSLRNYGEVSATRTSLSRRFKAVTRHKSKAYFFCRFDNLIVLMTLFKGEFHKRFMRNTAIHMSREPGDESS